MQWNKGYSAGYYATLVDPATWLDVDPDSLSKSGRFEITGGQVSRTDADMRASATIDCRTFPEGVERWVRLYMDAQQNENAQHEPLFTGLATSPARDINGTIIEQQLECYSVLKPLADMLLPRGWYAPAAASSASIMRQLLNVTPAPAEIADNAPALEEAIIAEEGETYQTMLDKVLLAIGWRLKLHGDGTIDIGPEAVTAAASFDPLDNDALEPDITAEQDWYSCPNVFRAVNDDVSGVARDDNPDSMLSTVSRGREVWAEDTSCNLNENETVAQYAARMLREAQRYSMTVKYTRRFHPEVQPSDLVRLHYPGQAIDGLFMVKSQNISLGYGCPTEEAAVYYGE